MRQNRRWTGRSRVICNDSTHLCVVDGRGHHSSREMLWDRADTLGVALGHIVSHLRSAVKMMLPNVLNYTEWRV